MVTLGWPIGNTNEDLWNWMERLNGTGRLDIQSHGYNHVYITEQTSETVIRVEILDPIPIIEQHFGKRPVAFIWPGGNFTPLAVAIAHEGGYQLGFTAFSRGPLMFNWIPQGEQERLVADPLMTLPRSWSTDQTLPLDIAEQIGAAARAEAISNYPQEAEYYRMYCGGELPMLWYSPYIDTLIYGIFPFPLEGAAGSVYEDCPGCVPRPDGSPGTAPEPGHPLVRGWH